MSGTKNNRERKKAGPPGQPRRSDPEHRGPSSSSGKSVEVTSNMGPRPVENGVESASGEALPNLPESWVWTEFEEVASIDSKLVSPADFPDYPHIAPDNIEKATGRLLEFNTIAEDGVKSNKNHFFPGQIVYSKIRPYLSKLIIAEFEGLCSADMYPISTSLELQYLFRYMLSDFFLDAVENQAGNRVVLPKVNQKQLNDVPVPIAPKAEQSRIVSAIESLQERSSRARDLLSEVGPLIGQLRQSVLRGAFSGRLTADWRAARSMGPRPVSPSNDETETTRVAENTATYHVAPKIPKSRARTGRGPMLLTKRLTNFCSASAPSAAHPGKPSSSRSTKPKAKSPPKTGRTSTRNRSFPCPTTRSWRRTVLLKPRGFQSTSPLANFNRDGVRSAGTCQAQAKTFGR